MNHIPPYENKYEPCFIFIEKFQMVKFFSCQLAIPFLQTNPSYYQTTVGIFNLKVVQLTALHLFYKIC